MALYLNAQYSINADILLQKISTSLHLLHAIRKNINSLILFKATPPLKDITLLLKYNLINLKINRSL